MDRCVIQDRVSVRHSTDPHPIVELHADRGARGYLRRIVSPSRRAKVASHYDRLLCGSWEGWYRATEPGLYLAGARRREWRHYWVLELRLDARPHWRLVAQAGLVRDLAGAVGEWFEARKETAIA